MGMLKKLVKDFGFWSLFLGIGCFPIVYGSLFLLLYLYEIYAFSHIISFYAIRIYFFGLVLSSEYSWSQEEELLFRNIKADETEKNIFFLRYVVKGESFDYIRERKATSYSLRLIGVKRYDETLTKKIKQIQERIEEVYKGK